MTLLLPTSYFPPVTYMSSIQATPNITIELYETFPKQTLRNRTVIPTANGAFTISVPVIKPNGTHSMTKDIKICYAEPWPTIHIRTIDAAYNTSPFYDYYRDDIVRLLSSQHKYLVDLNHTILEFLLHTLKINCTIDTSNDYIKDHDETVKDLREHFSYKRPTPDQLNEEYTQVFSAKYRFLPNMSIIDTLFNLGPETSLYLKKQMG